MYLSHLLIDVGNNPDRPRPGRLWLRNIYHVHQRLCMAFPADDRKNSDPHFLAPYKSDDFPQVHTQRSKDSGFLFRIDSHLGGNVSIIVLSAKKPDWDYAFYNADYLLAAKPQELRQLEVEIKYGTKFRFRLKVNPTRRLSKGSKFPNGDFVDDNRIGQRVPVAYQNLDEWLYRKAETSGFKIAKISNKTTGYVYFNRSNAKGQGQRLFSVCFDGVLEIIDAEMFYSALITGIGSAKAFGFGLLTISPMRPPY